MSLVNVYKAEDYDKAALGEIIDSILEPFAERLNSAFLILVKPNLLSPLPPERGVTTHPVLFEAVLVSLKKFTNARITVSDSPGASYGEYDNVLLETGIGEVCARQRVPFAAMESYTPVSGPVMTYSSIADSADIIINLPKVKTHSLTGLTLGVKNFFGFIPGTGKSIAHRSERNNIKFAEKIYKFFLPFNNKTITIIDGIIGVEGNGPGASGTPRKFGFIASSDDTLALDIAVSRILNLPDTFGLTNRAILNDGYPPDIEIKGEYPDIRNIKLPMSYRRTAMDTLFGRVLWRFINVKPHTDKSLCTSCGLCKKICPVSAIYNDGGLFEINRKRCIECYCCHEVCKQKAIKLKRSLAHKIFVK